jgi:hypothetical protein
VYIYCCIVIFLACDLAGTCTMLWIHMARERIHCRMADLLEAFACGCSGLVLCIYLDQILLICYALIVMIA